MGQAVILRASWKAIWGAPDLPPPVAAASIRLLLLTALPHDVFWLLTSLRTLLSQAWPLPVTGGWVRGENNDRHHAVYCHIP